MPDAGRTHGPPATKKQAAVTTGQPKHSGIPCAMVYGLLRTLPGVPGLLATVTREFVHGLDPSVGGSGPYDLAVRAHLARLARQARPSHPALHVRDDAYAPLHERETAR